jgi:hypothetical protein
MSDSLSQSQMKEVLLKVKQTLQVELDPEDFKSNSYSRSSLYDMLVQKISDTQTGEWTTDMAFHKIRQAISSIMNIDPQSIQQETSMDETFPAATRKANIKALEEKLGFPLDILKPNSAIYGVFIFLFFACIPFGIGMDWFLSGICMIVFGIIIYVLGKTGNSFRMKTVGHLADHVAWKNYLKQKQSSAIPDVKELEKKVKAILDGF